MIKFATRNAARSFANGSKKVINLGKDTIGSRWAVVILNK